ncbi:hypothetical protein ACET3Z_014920 [Daucus carota]
MGYLHHTLLVNLRSSPSRRKNPNLLQGISELHRCSKIAIPQYQARETLTAEGASNSPNCSLFKLRFFVNDTCQVLGEYELWNLT